MRDAFVRCLMKAAEKDPTLVLVTGDLGFGVLKPFWETYPKQFVNAGIAEQSMAGLAAGLAREGRKVFTYSIGNFPTLRCLEQIRNDCAYHEANVKVVCVGGGFVYGSLGMSHQATEDMAVMRSLPGVRVYTPADPVEVETVFDDYLNTPGTAYLRLSRGGTPTLHTDRPQGWQPGKPLTLREGEDVCLLAAGGILAEALGAADLLEQQGIRARVLSFPCIKPMDPGVIAELCKKYRHLVTVEEGNIIGGFGSAVAEIMSGLGSGAILHRIGLEDCYASVVGNQSYLLAHYGMNAPAIAEKTAAWVKE